MCGMRWGEAAGLTVGSLDLLRGLATIAHHLGRDGRLGEPKSYAGRRVLSLPSALVEMLARHLEAEGLTAADRDSLIFTTREGA